MATGDQYLTQAELSVVDALREIAAAINNHAIVTAQLAEDWRKAFGTEESK